MIHTEDDVFFFFFFFNEFEFGRCLITGGTRQWKEPWISLRPPLGFQHIRPSGALAHPHERSGGLGRWN